MLILENQDRGDLEGVDGMEEEDEETKRKCRTMSEKKFKLERDRRGYRNPKTHVDGVRTLVRVKGELEYIREPITF